MIEPRDPTKRAASILFLGCGASVGVPMIACRCSTCLSTDPRDKRTRSSILVRAPNGLSALIDSSTDFRAQALRHRIDDIDALFYTHHHADHIHGVDELRVYCFLRKKRIPTYGSRDTLDRIRSMFPYLFSAERPEGGEISKLDLIALEIGQRVSIGAITISPLKALHGSLEIYGYKIDQTAYLTDCSHIPTESLQALEGIDTLIVGAIGFESHPTHFTLERALEAIETIAPRRAYLTHTDHNLPYKETQNRLPANVNMAYDGLEIRI